MIKVIGISGSTRLASSNTKILRGLALLMPDTIEYSIDKGISELPHFNPDIEGANSPEEVSRFRASLSKADAIIICTPEYAKGVPGVLKNALDWLVSSAELYRKPVAIITASGFGEAAHQSLLLTLSMLNANVFEGGALLISAAVRSLMRMAKSLMKRQNSHYKE